MTRGSLELIYSDTSQGLPVAHLNAVSAPTIARAVWGVTDVSAVDPPREGTLGEWTCLTQGGIAGTIYYWQESENDPLAMARAMVAAADEVPVL
jgi:hypothetical protein